MIRLREYSEADIERLATIANNKNVSVYMVDTFPYPYRWEDAEWWIKTGCKEKPGKTFAIDVEGLCIGGIGVTLQEGWRRFTAEMGYWLGEEYWGRGLATQAVTDMTKWSFSNLEIHKLMAPVLEPNERSMRVLEKCGFELEGMLRDDVYKEGTFYNVYYYSRMNPSLFTMPRAGL